MIHQNIFAGFRKSFEQEVRLIYQFEYPQQPQASDDVSNAYEAIRRTTNEIRKLDLSEPERIRKTYETSRRHADMASQLLSANSALALAATNKLTNLINNPSLGLEDFERIVMGSPQAGANARNVEMKVAPESVTAPLTNGKKYPEHLNRPRLNIFGSVMGVLSFFMTLMKGKRKAPTHSRR